MRLAIDKAKHARTEGKEVTTLGQLVHNPGIKADLSDRGIRTADLADQVEGGTLVIRAHGVPKSEFEQVKGKESLEVIDATCTWVLQSQKAARELSEAGYTVCIIGHEDHPEVKGVRSYAGENHVVVDDMDRSTWERVPRTKKLGVLSQSDDPSGQARGVRRLLPAPMPRHARREHGLPGHADPPGRLGEARCARSTR